MDYLFEIKYWIRHPSISFFHRVARRMDEMKAIYENKFGKVPEVKAIHAGLECGILGGAYPHWDMISFGPTMRFPHSPDEKVLIPTVEKFWDFLTETLKNAPVK